MMKILKKIGKAWMNGIYEWGAAVSYNGKIIVNM